MTAVGRTARPRFRGLPKLRSLPPLARREALWGYLFIAPVDHRLLPVHARADDRVAGVHVQQHRARPAGAAGVRRAAQLADAARRRARRGSRSRVTFRFALFQLPFILILPFLLAVGLNSRNLKGPRRVPDPVLPALRDPVRLGRPDLAGDAQPRDRLGEPVPAVPRASRTRPTGSTTAPVIYPALVMIGIWGIGAGIIVNLAGLRGIPTELYDAARIDGAGWWASLRHVTLPMMSPIIFYTLILGGRRRPPVLPRPAGHQQRHRRAGRHAPRSSTSTCTRTSSPTRTWPTARRSPGCCSSSPWRSRWSCSGPRAAGSTTRRSARHGRRGDRSRTWPARPRSRARRGSGAAGRGGRATRRARSR